MEMGKEKGGEDVKLCLRTSVQHYGLVNVVKTLASICKDQSRTVLSQLCKNDSPLECSDMLDHHSSLQSAYMVLEDASESLEKLNL